MTIDNLTSEYNRQLPLYDSFRQHLQSVIINLMQGEESVLSVTSRLKSLPSLTEKVLRKSAQSLSEIRDLVGIRIVVSDRSDFAQILQKITNELLANIESSTNWLDDPRYQNIHLTVSVGAERAGLPEWKPFDGLKAEIQIKSELAQAWDNVRHLSAYTLARDASASLKLLTGIEEADRLSQIVDDFALLIEKPGVHEKREIHRFLEDHKFILHPNPEEIWSEVPIGLGTEFRMDFMIREPDGEFLLTEIENPRHRLFTKEGDFAVAVNHAQRQVEDWQDWVEDNISTMQKTYPGIISPRGLVIIGRSRGLSDVEERKLRRRNINLRGRLKIITYDELIAGARTFIQSIKRHLQK